MSKGENVVRVSGYALVLGDDIDTDTIIPSTYLHLTSPQELAKGVFANTPSLKKALESTKKPIIIVAGKGFGYGSSREHAAIALRAAGVAAILAISFHRIFYRNAINNGLLAIEIPTELYREVKNGDYIEIEISSTMGSISIGNKTYRVKPLPKRVLEILQLGGIHEILKQLARAKT